MNVINIIPSDYSGDPRKALGYAWQDYATKTPGVDVIVENNGKGIDYMAAAREKMAELGMTKATINCMWCGGFDGEITLDDVVAPKNEQPAPLSVEEIAINERAFEQTELEEMDRRNEKHTGYCPKCHTYCYGDCEANS